MQESRLLLRLIEQPECEWVEFKESWFEPHSVGRYVSALANGARLANRPAGYLVWGISNAREVVGTTFDPFTQRVGNQPFELWLKSQITPAGHGIRFISFEHYGLQVVILEIGTAEGVPTRFDGAPSIRVGEATPRLDAHPDREKRLLEALVQTSFEGTWAREDVTGDEVFELLDVDHALSLLTQRPEATSTDERLDQLENFRLIQQASPT